MIESNDNKEILEDNNFDEKTIEELREETFQRPRKIYDKLNVSVRQLDILMGVLFVGLILLLILGAR